MDDFYNLQGCKDAFPCASVLVEGRYLYFTTIYNNVLYKLDLNSRELEKIKIPIGNKKMWAFRTIVYDGDKLFLVPNTESFFLKFDLVKKEFESVFQELYSEKKMNPSIRACEQKEKQIFLLDATSNSLLVLDLEKECCIHNMQLTNYNEEEQFYISLKICDDFLIVFGKPKKFFLKINIYNYSVEKIEVPHEILFGEVVGKEFFYTPNESGLLKIFKYNLENGETTMVGEAKEDVMSEVVRYRFWNTKRIGEKVFFLPHDASKIVSYDLGNSKVTSIVPYDKEKYFSRRSHKEMAVYDLIPYKGNYIVIPFDGNIISLIDESGNVVDSYHFAIDEEVVRKCFFQAEDIVFEKQFTLRDLLEGLKLEVK